MKIINSNHLGGWFVGDFDPCLLRTKDIELGFKRIPKGTKPDYHYHTIKTEYTILIEGKIFLETSAKLIEPITTIVLYPNEKNDQLFIEDSLIMIINTPSMRGDKYI